MERQGGVGGPEWRGREEQGDQSGEAGRSRGPEWRGKEKENVRKGNSCKKCMGKLRNQIHRTCIVQAVLRICEVL